MSHEELRAAQQRLKVQLAEILNEQGSKETDTAALRHLLEELQALTQEYDEKLTEAEVQIAELKRELFGSKADRLTPEQQEQLSALNHDLESEAQRSNAASSGVLDEDEEEDEKKKKRNRSHSAPFHGIS
jgi:hypothetical protein